MTSHQKLFDIFVQIKEGLKLRDVERLSYEIHAVPREQMDMILKAFQHSPRIKVGQAVNRERADKANMQLSQIGLDVFAIPVLSLAPVEETVKDNLHLCEACNTQVVLPPNRQCPHCGVFVDKISSEALLRKKIKDNERLKLEMQAQQEFKASEKRNQQLLEDALRKEIRKELEAEFGIEKEKTFFDGNLKWLKITTVVLLFPIGFYGGFVFSRFGAMGQSGSTVANTGQNNGLGAAGGAFNLDALVSEGLNPEDGFFQPNKPSSVSMQQALQAATTLGKSSGGIGNPGMAGTVGGRSSSLTDARLNAAINEGAENGQAPVDLKISAQQRRILLVEFARQLADMRQFQRASQALTVLKNLADKNDRVEFAMSAPMVELEIKTFKLMALSAAQASKGLEALQAEVLLMPNPADRGWALSRIGVIASRHLMLPPSVAQSYVSLAEKSMLLVVNVQERNQGMNALKVATGEVYLAEVNSLVRSGQWSKVPPVLQKFAQLLASTADPHSLIRLHALDSQMKKLIAQPGAAPMGLEPAFALLLNMPDPAEQAVLLREVLNLSQAFENNAIFKLAADIKTRLLTEKNPNAHLALMQLALLYKEADMINDFEAVAQQIKDLSPATAALNSVFYTETVLRGDLIVVKKSHAAGQYYNAESQLRRLADILAQPNAEPLTPNLQPPTSN